MTDQPATTFAIGDRDVLAAWILCLCLAAAFLWHPGRAAAPEAALFAPATPAATSEPATGPVLCAEPRHRSVSNSRPG